MSSFNTNQTNFEHTFGAKVNFLSSIFAAEKLDVRGDSILKQVEVSDINIKSGILTATTLDISGNITANNITANNDITITGDLAVGGELTDGAGNFGSAGQVLSSNGTNTTWINTSDTNVGSASNVGTNVDSTNADQFITFVETSSGNNPIRVDTNLTYNPSTNTMSGINFSGTSTFNTVRITGNVRIDGQLQDADGDFGSSGQILASDGTNTNWINASAVSAGSAAEVAITATNDNAAHFLTFVDGSTGSRSVEVDTNLTYNPSTNTLGAGSFTGNVNAANLNSGTIPDGRFPSTLPAVSGANLTNLDASDLSSGTIPNGRFPSTLPAVSGANLTNLPAGNLTGALPAIDGSALTGIVSIPTGVIVMWSGAVSAIPSGWVLCNGSNNTPDLRSRFIVGATGDGSNNVTFNADTGAVSGNYSVDATGGSVAHQLTVAEMPSHSHVYSRANSPGGGQDQAGSGSGDAVNHSNTTTQSTGGNDFHENRPPYYALAFIMKT